MTQPLQNRVRFATNAPKPLSQTGFILVMSKEFWGHFSAIRPHPEQQSQALNEWKTPTTLCFPMMAPAESEFSENAAG